MGDTVRGQNEPRNGDTAVISYADSSTLSSSVYDEGMENDYNRVIASAASMPDSADISAVIGDWSAAPFSRTNRRVENIFGLGNYWSYPTA